MDLLLVYSSDDDNSTTVHKRKISHTSVNPQKRSKKNQSFTSKYSIIQHSICKWLQHSQLLPNVDDDTKRQTILAELRNNLLFFYLLFY